jgi:hypothetical protein
MTYLLGIKNWKMYEEQYFDLRRDMSCLLLTGALMPNNSSQAYRAYLYLPHQDFFEAIKVPTGRNSLG